MALRAAAVPALAYWRFLSTPTVMTTHARTDRYGFRLRGGENTRIEAFTDAAFAFAVTLLVIGGSHPPTNVNELLDALAGVPAYAASFALLCLFWYSHYIWYLRYGIEDRRSVLLSLALVFLVLIYVYPLHMLFSAALSVPGSGLSPERVGADPQHEVALMFVIYGVAYAALSGIILLFHVHAWSLRDLLELDPAEQLITRSLLLRWVFNVAIGLLSAALALVIPRGAPPASHALPGMAYLLLAISGRLLARQLRRQLAAVRV